MKTVYVLYEENGCYSDYRMAIIGVYSTRDRALAQIVNPVSLGVEQWDGTVVNEGEYTSGPRPVEHDPDDETTYTIVEYTIDAPSGNSFVVKPSSSLCRPTDSLRPTKCGTFMFFSSNVAPEETAKLQRMLDKGAYLLGYNVPDPDKE